MRGRADSIAPELRMVPEKVTHEMITDLLQKQLLTLEEEMIKNVTHERRLGPPYNYKERQLEQMDKWVQDMTQQIRGAAPREATPQPAAEAVK